MIDSLGAIISFDGEERFLSNFFFDDNFKVTVEGMTYPTAEHAFQAMKTDSRMKRKWIREAESPGQAKRRGRQVLLRSDWEEVKVTMMMRVLMAKFNPERNLQLAHRLVDTRGFVLVEGNGWNDTFWGACFYTSLPDPDMPVWHEEGNIPLVGYNNLGVLLMDLRTRLIQLGVT